MDGPARLPANAQTLLALVLDLPMATDSIDKLYWVFSANKWARPLFPLSTFYFGRAYYGTLRQA